MKLKFEDLSVKFVLSLSAVLSLWNLFIINRLSLAAFVIAGQIHSMHSLIFDPLIVHCLFFFGLSWRLRLRLSIESLLHCFFCGYFCGFIFFIFIAQVTIMFSSGIHDFLAFRLTFSISCLKICGRFWVWTIRFVIGSIIVTTLCIFNSWLPYSVSAFRRIIVRLHRTRIRLWVPIINAETNFEGAFH